MQIKKFTDPKLLNGITCNIIDISIEKLCEITSP